MLEAAVDMSLADIAGDDSARVHAPVRGESARGHRRILVVEDDDDARRALERLLRADGFVVSGAANGEAALAEARLSAPDIVLTDLQMQPIDGLELCKRLRDLYADLPVILMTAHSDLESAIAGLRERAEDYLVKPVQYEAVLWCVERAIVRRDARREHEEMQRALNERLVASSVRLEEQAAAETRHRVQLETLLVNLSEGVIVAQPRGASITINDTGRAILGIDRDDRAPAGVLEALDVRALDDRPLAGELRPLSRALRGDGFRDYEVLLVRAGGERRHVVSTGTCVRDEAGDVALAIVVFRDVTELRRLERQRDEYLALVSHDLRNPLSVVLLALDTLRESMAEGGGRRRVGRAALVDLASRAERNAKRMQVMLDELRDATSLEASGLELRRAPCDMRELVDHVVDSLDDARARRIDVESSGAAPHLVLADAPRLERVIANLVTNALKYSVGESPVSLRLSRREGVIRLDVIDRGIGIGPESAGKLFQRYYRTTAGKEHGSGVGLGLYIARSIVQLHGGSVTVSSEVGKGSTFTLILPAHA